ncbi:MAG TPA: GNAT family N-acetyltransferase [Thermoplasmata archaeon]|nr:GNAT family N-acetyltransferase [Thermoplasmata archaeon]
MANRVPVSEPLPPLRFRPVRPAELGPVFDVLEEVSRWEEEIGLPHPWPRPFPRERMTEAAARGEVYAIEDDRGEMLGTVTLQWEDLPFWGARPPDAGYVHRLAVRRRHAGRSIGRRALDWAETETRNRGRIYLRLDCLVESDRLHAYYTLAGFSPIGDVTVGGLRCRLYERRIGPM